MSHNANKPQDPQQAVIGGANGAAPAVVPMAPKSGGAATAILAAVVTAALTFVGQWIINLKGIEEPKLRVEEKKVALEAYKQTMALSPNIVTDCNPRMINKWSWAFNCSSKNAGQYAVDIKLTGIKVRLRDDPDQKEYDEGVSFSFPKNKNMFRAMPGSEGDLLVYLNFDKSVYPDGINRGDINVVARLEYEAIKSAQDYIVENFPSSKSLMGEAAHQFVSQSMRLPISGN